MFEVLLLLVVVEVILVGVVFESLFKNEKGSDLLLFGSGDFDSEALLNMKLLKLLSFVFDSLSSLFSSVLPIFQNGFFDGFINNKYNKENEYQEFNQKY